ncbi:MAG: IucA/IucC family C-terminal-domain containing protein [archaeon]
MLLEELTDKTYVHCERYINLFKKVSNDVNPDYCAINGLEHFLLPHALLPPNDVQLSTAQPREELLRTFVHDKVLFFVHPEEASTFNLPLSYTTIARPTASTRTVIPDGAQYAVKLHLNKRLSRFIRRLTESSVRHSIAISRELEKARMPASFAFLPECIGVCYNDRGMIVRDMTPRPIIEKRQVLPLFSLYAPDLKDETHIPFFRQLVEKHDAEPLDYFLTSIVKPLFTNLAHAIRNYGLLLEPHGQNVLIEFDKQWNITRLVHRDFQSMYVDNDIRKEKGLALPFTKHIMGEECAKEISYSLVYDNYVGKYVFEPFTEYLQRDFGIEKERSRAAIREYFAKLMPQHCFPKGQYLMAQNTFKDNNTEVQYCDERAAFR